MSAADDEEKKLLAHHEQLPLCTTRLPYRQGRKLTAVKVYTVNDESNHLLVFGVPSLNLRQEAKSLFLRFGKLLLFTVSTTHPAEDFTETYHVKYERIQSARIAKKMIDTKNFYGGSLHICYAPEFESIEETRTKLLQRKNDVTYRLRNLQKESAEIKSNAISDAKSSNSEINSIPNVNLSKEVIVNELSCTTNNNFNNHEEPSKKLNMGERNIIYLDKRKRKKRKEIVIEKRFKPCFQEQDKEISMKKNVEIIDCTSTDKEVVSNINEALNYNKFGNEVIKKIEVKPLNKIVFKNNKNS